MIRHALTALALTGAGLVMAASPSAAQPHPAGPEPATKVRPGYWRYETKVSIFGGGSETKCLKAAEIERFMFNPCNSHHNCTYPVKQVGGGRMHLEGQWVEKKKGTKIPITADGTYTQTTLAMTAHIKILGGIPVTGQIKGTWLSDSCPPGAK
jgi:hypothetical protein